MADYSQEMERPEGAKYWTCADMEDWLREHYNPHPINKVADLAVWWKAWKDAGVFFDSTHKELARMLVNGIDPVDETDVTEELRARYGYYDADGQRDPDATESMSDINAALEKEWTQFFNWLTVKGEGEADG